MLRELNRREQLVLLIGGLTLVTTLLVFGVISPYQSSLDRLDKRISTRQKQAAALSGQFQEYRLLKAEAERVSRQARQAGDVSLISFVEATAVQIAARDRLVYLRPQPAKSSDKLVREAVEVKLERIRLDQLVKLLHEIETAPGLLQATQLRIKTRFDDPSQLDAVMTLVSYGGES